MPSREPGDTLDPAAELLGRWEAHHHGRPGSSDDQAPTESSAGSSDPGAAVEPEEPEEPENETPRERERIGTHYYNH